MSIPSVAYKAPLLSLLHALGANMPGAQDLVEKFEAAVRDEEWGRAVASGYVEATACPRCSTEACSVCPADKTRYCP